MSNEEILQTIDILTHTLDVAQKGVPNMRLEIETSDAIRQFINQLRTQTNNPGENTTYDQ